MRVHVAFTPSEAATADLGIVVDVVRATSSIAQALASGYRRVLCCAEVERARALRASLGDAVGGGALRRGTARQPPEPRRRGTHGRRGRRGRGALRGLQGGLRLRRRVLRGA